MPEPVTSVRSPQTAPEPKLNCMSDTPFQKPLQRLHGGVGDIPGLGIAGDCRTRKIVLPPALDQLIDRGGPRFRGGGGVLDLLGRSDASPGNFDCHRDTPTSRVYCSMGKTYFGL